jgi:hypothetical protein
VPFAGPGRTLSGLAGLAAPELIAGDPLGGDAERSARGFYGLALPIGCDHFFNFLSVTTIFASDLSRMRGRN